jgi:hypothetical protein
MPFAFAHDRRVKRPAEPHPASTLVRMMMLGMITTLVATIVQLALVHYLGIQ